MYWGWRKGVSWSRSTFVSIVPRLRQADASGSTHGKWMHQGDRNIVSKWLCSREIPNNTLAEENSWGRLFFADCSSLMSKLKSSFDLEIMRTKLSVRPAVNHHFQIALLLRTLVFGKNADRSAHILQHPLLSDIWSSGLRRVEFLKGRTVSF